MASGPQHPQASCTGAKGWTTRRWPPGTRRSALTTARWDGCPEPPLASLEAPAAKPAAAEAPITDDDFPYNYFCSSIENQSSSIFYLV